MRPFPTEEMRTWPVSTYVNKPENDDPSILVIDSMKPIGSGGWSITHRPHPEEAQSAVSKDGRWLGLACGRPSRRAHRSQACADCVNLSARAGSFRTRLIDLSI